MVAQAQRIVNVMKDIVARTTRNGANIGYRYGVVSAWDNDGPGVKVILAGDEDFVTDDIRVPAGAYLNAGDYVMVAQAEDGDSWVEQILPTSMYSALAIDAGVGRVMVGDGSSYAMSPGTSGQLLFSGGVDGSVYWADNFAVELRLEVRNVTGSSIAKGKVVYITGASGQTPTVALADSDFEATSSSTIGVTAEAIANTSTGYIITKGVLRGIDTSAFSEGDAVWLSQTAGGLVNVAPSAPVHGVRVGNIVKSHASSGELLVDIHNGLEISELHDVRLGTPLNGQALLYNSSSGYWSNSTITTATALDDLTDVTITTPSSGQALKYNGSAWVNGTAAATIDDLTDVAITSPVSGNILSYNGSDWVNSTPAGNTYLGTALLRTGTQSITNSTDTAIDFTSTGSAAIEYWDIGNWHNLSSSSTKIIPSTSGYMQCTATVAFASNSTGNRWLYVVVNGGVSGGALNSGTTIARETVPASSGVQTWVSAAGAYYFNGTTDYVEVYVQQTSGGALNATHATLALSLAGGVKGDTGATGSTGPGVASGGTAGQYLKKNSGTDYDTTWYSLLGSTAPSTQAVGDSASAGSSAEAAHVDHKHAMPAFGAATAETSFGLSSSNGVATTIARSDHAHGTPTNPVTGHEAAADPHTGYVLESTSATQTVVTTSAAATPLIVKGAASQSADIFSIQNNAGTKLIQVASDGTVYKNGNIVATEDRMVDKAPYWTSNQIVTGKGDISALILTAAGTQTSDIFVVEASGGTDYFTINGSGTVAIAGNTVPVVTSSAPTVALSSSASAGTSTTALRSDATIAAFDATAPSTQAIGDAAATGSAAYAARRDHVHAMPAFGAVTAQTSFGGSSGNGTAVTVAHSDHTHGTPTNPVTAHEAAADPHTGYLQETVVSGLGTPSLTLSTTNSAGAGTTVIGAGATIAAFDATTPQVAAYTGATGSAGYAARRDHSHAVSLTSTSAMATAETGISAATYADITGPSVSLAAGTWLLLGIINARSTTANQAYIINGAITDGSNTVIAEGSQNVPASGTASVQSVGSVSLSAIVAPSGTTTYKLRGAKGASAPTNNWTAVDGAATNVTNNASTNTDKGTGILAIRIA